VVEKIAIDKIHQSSNLIDAALGDKLEDITPSYNSIAIFTQIEFDQLVEVLENLQSNQSNELNQFEVLTVPICYEFGKDLNRVAMHNQLTKEEVIEIHLKGVYQSAVIGFQPGFTYAEGLDNKIHCPRKSIPERKVPAGSVGIGGHHTGIYSFDSPGGWNIIGRTPIQLFDASAIPPVKISLGQKFRFNRISKEAFEKWEE